MLEKPLDKYHYAFTLINNQGSSPNYVRGPMLSDALGRTLTDGDFQRDTSDVMVCGHLLPVYRVSQTTPCTINHLALLFGKKEAIDLKMKIEGASTESLKLQADITHGMETYKLTLWLDCYEFYQYLAAGGTMLNNEIVGKFRFNCGHGSCIKFVSL